MESFEMGPHDKPHLSYPEELWFDWLRDGILNKDIDLSGKTPLLHYLLDLNILESESNGLLKLSEVNEGLSGGRVKNLLIESLNTISSTENGFALVYFLSSFSDKKLPPLTTEPPAQNSKRKKIFNNRVLPRHKKTSDLSNLQIVKKWGNQMRGFLDVEQKTIARLRGFYTSQKDAQWMFSYMLSKTKEKSPAREWEQISRKRHR